MEKNITLTLGQYLTMSEAHINNLVAQGYNINIVGDMVSTTSNIVRENPQQIVSVANKPATVSKTNSNKTTHSKSENKKTTKGSSKTKSTKLSAADYKEAFAIYLRDLGKINEVEFKDATRSVENITSLYKKWSKKVKFDNSKAIKIANKYFSKSPKVKVEKASLAKTKTSSETGNKLPKNLGKIKVGDYFKCINLKTGKAVNVGIAESINEVDKIVTTKSGNKFLLGNCVAINKATFGKLHKKFEKKSIKISPVDYKIVYAANLLKLGKITEEDFAKAKDDKVGRDFAAELYKQFKGEIKLSNSEAIKILAENSSANKPVETASSTEETTNA